METLGGRLRFAREMAGMDQQELSKLSGVKQTTLSKIERERTHRSGDVAILAHVLNIEALWLANGIDPMRAPTKTDSLVNQSHKDADVNLFQIHDPRCKFSPNYGNEQKPFLPTVSVPYAVFEELRLDDSQFFGHINHDEAMNLTVPIGGKSAVYHNESDPAMNSGRIYAIMVGDACILRRIFINARGGYRLSCDNPDKTAYPDEDIPASETTAIRILGRLRWRSGVE